MSVHKDIQNLFLLAVFLLMCSVVSAQGYKVKTKAPALLFVGEQFRLEYTIETDREIESSIEIGEIRGFDYIVGPSVLQTVMPVRKNGEIVKSVTTKYTYILEARQKGKIELPKATITVGGKKYRSDILKIEVKSLFDNADEIHAFVKTIISRPSVNLSDTLMLTYKLYTSQEIERIVKSDFPLIKDFFSSNITNARQPFVEEKIDGKTYRVVDLRTLILQPRSVGQKIIPAGEITLEYAIPTGRKLRDRWGAEYDETMKKNETLTIDSVKIGVHNLQGI